MRTAALYGPIDGLKGLTPAGPHPPTTFSHRRDSRATHRGLTGGTLRVLRVLTGGLTGTQGYSQGYAEYSQADSSGCAARYFYDVQGGLTGCSRVLSGVLTGYSEYSQADSSGCAARYFYAVQGGLTGYPGHSQGYSPVLTGCAARYFYDVHGGTDGVPGALTGYSPVLTGCAARYFYDVQSPWLETDVKGALASGQAVPWLSGNGQVGMAKWEWLSGNG